MNRDLEGFIEGRARLLLEKRRGECGPAHVWASELAAGLLARIRTALDQNDARTAFDLGSRAKSLRLPTEGLDYLRARAFLALGLKDDAAQSLKEELRFFPGNCSARDLLAELTASSQAPALEDRDPFLDIFEAVREHTMLSRERLRSLFDHALSICERDVPGNFVECGVAAGGSSALLAMVIARHSRRPRTLFSFDTFEGMPDAGDRDVHQGVHAESTGWGAGTCAAPESSVRRVFEELGVSRVVTTVKGLFQDTLPAMRENLSPVAMLHLDGDWYDSTLTVLETLHGSYSPGGGIQIDDYGYWDGCRQAVHDYGQRRGLDLHVHPIDSTGVWLDAPE
jgi:hypothetical protein